MRAVSDCVSFISKHVGATYKDKHYVDNHALRMLYLKYLNKIIFKRLNGWGKAASFHLHPLSVVLKQAI